MSDDQKAPLDSISRRIDAEARADVPPQIRAAAGVVRAAVDGGVVAVLFYGSALRDGVIADKVIDLYVLVDRYRNAYDSVTPAVANAALPPNVYYLAAEGGGRTVRMKYAVLSLADFEKQTAGGALTPYIWGRFAQPTAVVYARDTLIHGRVIVALGAAVRTLLCRTAALMEPEFLSEDLWARAFRESYRTELRAEKKSKNQELYAVAKERYDQMTADCAALSLGFGPTSNAGTYQRSISGIGGLSTRIAWGFRRFAGKILSVLRLIKAAFTFANGVDYILWKVERHSGVKITPTEWQRRHPLMAAVTLFWRLYFRGGFR
jgi:hypothetical protein